MYGMVANVKSDRVLRTGAKVWIRHCNGDAERPFVQGCSKRGRVVTKFIPYKRLENFRAAWIPDHMRDDIVFKWQDKGSAEWFCEQLTRIWSGVRFYHRDGTMMADGVTPNEGFQRLRAATGESDA